jgi:hypothetical protein
MKWVTAGVTFVNLSVVCGLLLGLAGRGLTTVSAALALLCGAAFAIAALLGTRDDAVQPEPADGPTKEQKPRKGSESEDTKNALPSALMRYRTVWFWAVAICFAVFALRSFIWLLYIDGSDLKIQSPNNLGDLSLHLTLVKTFANGVPLWPDNPIFAGSKLRYPAGIDMFNGLLSLVHIDMLAGLVWVGLLASLAIFWGFYRWGGTFAVAGFLFNGGIAGFQFVKTFKFLDYQGAAADIAKKPIAWKSIALSMLVTQRGWLYAIPAGLVLLWHWRERFFSQSPAATADSPAVAVAQVDDPGQSGDAVKSEATTVNGHGSRKGPLPWWVELSIYASLPLFHLHTFIALTIVLVVALFFERVRGLAIFTDAPIRRHAAALLLAAFIPATFFVWTTTDHFQAKSVMKWHSGWAQDSTEFAAPFFRLGPKDFGSSTSFGLLLQKTWNGVIAPFFQFWLPNFGLWVPLVLVLVGLCFWRIWKGKWRWGDTPPAGIAFILAAVVIFGVGYFVQTAPWEWDNLKLMIWGYFIILPFLWSDLVGRWVFPERAVTCLLLFGSGFVTLLGGLTAGHPGFGLIERARLDHIGTVLRPLPMDARFATWPTFNHPILLQGRKAVLGYPGHLWTEGFDYGKTNDKLTALMNGAANWRDIAKELGVRYIFWGQDEKANYQSSTRPWEATAFLVGTGDWGAIYDLDKPAPHN